MPFVQAGDRNHRALRELSGRAGRLRETAKGGRTAARARGHADAHASGGDGWGNTGGGNSFLRSSMGNSKDLPKNRQEDNPRAIGRCHHDMFGVPLANTLLLHDNPEGEESGPDTSSTGGKRILRGVSIGRRES